MQGAASRGGALVGEGKNRGGMAAGCDELARDQQRRGVAAEAYPRRVEVAKAVANRRRAAAPLFSVEEGGRRLWVD